MPTSTIQRYLLILVIFMGLNSIVIAQGNPSIVLSVRLSDFMQFLDTSTVFSDFEDSHPNIELNIIYSPTNFEEYIPSAQAGLDEHLQAVDSFTQGADVLMISVGEGLQQLSLEATRAGYILDLAPLFNASPTTDPSAYYPSVWQASQWDGGLWLLPTSAIIYSVVYDPVAFDTSSIAYPNVDWTIHDFANAISVLAQRDASGKIIVPGFIGFNGSDGGFFTQLLSQPLYDVSQFPPVPNFLTSDAIEMAEILSPLYQAGIIYNPNYDYGDDFSIGSIPLTTDRVNTASFNNLEVATFPNGEAQVNVNGFAVSSRTDYPQLAYELANYLAGDLRVAQAMNVNWGGMRLARPEYPDVVPIDNAPFMIGNNNEAEHIIIESALVDGIPASETLYFPYFRSALWNRSDTNLDIETTLRDAEIIASDNLQLASEQRTEIIGTIPTPIPEIALASDEIALTFYIQEGDLSIWQTLADEFVETDPQVARINLLSRSYPFDYTQEDVDCFYHNGNSISSEYLFAIDPLLAIDESLNNDEWLLSNFNDSQNLTYAFQMDIRPVALWYDPAQLDEAGIMPPTTNSELLSALDILSNEETPSLASFLPLSSILILIANNGGLPINYDTNPITIDFTSDANINAIQAVLDLAKRGIIKYGDGLSTFSSNISPDDEPFIVDIVAESNFRDARYQPSTFPAGSIYTPVSFEIMSGYISRFAQNPEACYRFLSSISQQSHLLSGLPVRRSVAMQSTRGNFYDSFEAQSEATNRVQIPSYFTTEEYFTSLWLFRAFDRYILEDADLFTELSIAQDYTLSFLSCLNNDGDARICASQTDPTIESPFSN